MYRRSFCLWLIVALLIFAAVSLGGCGGSSNSFSGTPSTSTDTPNITDVFNSEEFERVLDDLTTELVSEGISPESVIAKIHSLLILSGDVIDLDDDTDTSSAKYSAASLTPESLALIAAKFKPAYESGDIIALYFPTPKAINELYVALGEQPMYIDPDDLLSADADVSSADLYPEIYAIAKRYNGTSAHYFSYLVPGSMAITGQIVNEVISKMESADRSSDESVVSEGDSTTSEYECLRGEFVFQARRYAAFIRWAAHIDAEMEKQREFASSSLSVMAAEGSTNVFDYSAQRESINLDYYKADVDWDYWGKDTWSFSAGVNYTIYSFHNFGDRNDYYVVQSDGFVKPDFKTKTVNGDKYTVGSIHSFYYGHEIVNASYSLFNNAPANINRQSSRTDGTSHSTSSTIGIKVGAKVGVGSTGPSAEMSAEMDASTTKGTGYSHSATWTTTEWSLTNQCTSTLAQWLVDCYDPDNKYFPFWNTGDLPTASKNRIDYASEWMWQVTQPNPKIAMKLSYKVEIRDTKLTHDNSWRYSSSWWHKSTRTVKLNQPPHVICTYGKSYTFTRGGANNVEFRFLCNGRYTIKSNQSWCQIAAEDAQGSDTGINERSVFFFVDPYDTGSDTTIHTRRAVITITDTETGQIQTVDVMQSNR